MIQRKQTLFLLFAIIFIASFLLCPVIKIYGAPNFDGFSGWDIKQFVNWRFLDGYYVYVNLIAEGIATGLLLLTIFLFKYRKIQLALCWLSLPFIAVGPLFTYYRWSQLDVTNDTAYYFGNINGLVVLVCVFFAISFIRKDEQLIKSLDRLR